MLGIIGILLLVQGVGGLINRMTDSESEAWFLQLRFLPEAAHMPASIVLAVLGAVIFAVDTAQRRKARRAKGERPGGG